MSEVLTKVVVDCSAGTTEVLPLTADEIAQREANQALYAERMANEQAAAEALATLKASAKAKLVAGEPLTEEEAATIVL
jgi:hypothetical protein